MRAQARRDLLGEAAPAAGLREGALGRRANRNMVGVAIRAIRPKGYKRVGLERANDRDKRAGQLVRVGLLQGAIHVVEQARFAHAQLRAGGEKLAPAHRAKRAPRCRLRIANLPGLPGSRRHHHHIPAFGHMLGKRAARAEAFVVGVGEDRKQARLPLFLHCILHISHSFIPRTRGVAAERREYLVGYRRISAANGRTKIRNACDLRGGWFVVLYTAR